MTPAEPPRAEPTQPPPAPAAAHLDDVDRRLLRILQADGRTPYATMAPAVGLSAPAVRLRVQRLVDTGVLQIVGVTDPIALGFPVMALVAVQSRGDVRQLADAIGGLANVVYVVLTSGAHDLLVEVVCRSSEELLEIVNDRLRALDGVVSTQVWQYYGIHTHRFTWGVPDEPARP